MFISNYFYYGLVYLIGFDYLNEVNLVYKDSWNHLAAYLSVTPMCFVVALITMDRQTWILV